MQQIKALMFNTIPRFVKKFKKTENFKFFYSIFSQNLTVYIEGIDFLSSTNDMQQIKALMFNTIHRFVKKIK